MQVKEQKATLITFGIFSAVYIVLFILDYIASYTPSGVVTVFISSYFTEAAAFLVQPIAAMMIFITYCMKNHASAVIRALIYAAPMILYNLPHFAFEYAYLGYEITEVVLLTLLRTSLLFILTFAEYILLFLIMLLIVKRLLIAKCKRDCDLKNELKSKHAFDFSSPLAVSAFSVSFIVFLYALIKEIIETVTFFLNYSESFTFGELALILFRYIFILALLVTSQVLSFFVKNKFTEGESS